MDSNIQLSERDIEILQGIERGEYSYNSLSQQYVNKNLSIQSSTRFDGYLVDGLISITEGEPYYPRLILTGKGQALLSGVQP